MSWEFIILLVFIVAGAAVFIGWRMKNTRLIKSAENTANLVLSEPNHSKELEIADIESLILKDNDGRELPLTRLNTAQSPEKRYREICVRGSSAAGHALQGAMPVLAQAQTLNEIAKAAPNGLFTATAPVGDLMKLSGGTVGSAVMKDGKIAAQAGFAEVALSTVNPVAVVAGAMQAMALISGQYYMNEISKQLENVNSKLEKLIGYHHDEKIGVLRSANRELSELVSKAHVDNTDIDACRGIAKSCSEVYFEYLTRLERANVDAAERWINKAKELRELGSSIDDSELNFSIQMCCQASALQEKCKLAEIAIRMKSGAGQERFISEQAESLRNSSIDAFHRNVQLYIDEHYEPVLERLDKIADAKKIPLLSGNTAEETKNVQRRKAAILQTVVDDGNGNRLTEKMLRSLCEPQETLIMLGETPDAQRVFVLDEEQWDFE